MRTEQFNLADSERERLLALYKRAHNAYFGYIDEIPLFIISGGIVMTGGERGKQLASATVYKCQRNWLTNVTSLAYGKNLSQLSEEIQQLGKYVTSQLTERSNTPIDADPHSRKDDYDRWHRMTTREEIDTANAFLLALMQEIVSVVGSV